MCAYHFYWTKPETHSRARTHTFVRFTGSAENSCIYWLRNEDTKPTHWQLHNIISIKYKSTEYQVVTAKYFPVFSLLYYLFILVCNTQPLNVKSFEYSDIKYIYVDHLQVTETHMTHHSFIPLYGCICALGIEYWYNTHMMYAEWVSINALDSGNCVNCLLRLSQFQRFIQIR